MLAASADDVMPLAFTTCVRSPRMRPSVSARPRRLPSTVAFCGPVVAEAVEPAVELDADRMDARSLNLTITRPSLVDSARWVGVLCAGAYSAAIVTAATAAVAAIPRLTALSSRLKRAIALSRKLDAPSVGDWSLLRV